jgi:phospholipid-binding lipoprotein MlaA
LRDAAGLAGDAFLDPVNYLDDLEAILAVKAFKAENEVSLRIGDYEDLKKSAVDPYAALKDAYLQHRARKVPR